MNSILWAIDVDGTLANNSHRHSTLIQSADWDSFFDSTNMLLDLPVLSAKRHFDQGKFKHGEHLILTARPECTRPATLEWLVREGFVTQETRVLMKPDLIRFQRSSVFKPSALVTLDHEYPGRKIILIDDHQDILDALAGSLFETRAAPECWDDDTCWP